MSTRYTVHSTQYTIRVATLDIFRSLHLEYTIHSTQYTIHDTRYELEPLLFVVILAITSKLHIRLAMPHEIYHTPSVKFPTLHQDEPVIKTFICSNFRDFRYIRYIPTTFISLHHFISAYMLVRKSQKALKMSKVQENNERGNIYNVQIPNVSKA